MKSNYFKVFSCILLATILSLTIHIFLSEWAQPLMSQLTHGMSSGGPYSMFIMVSAYGTAFISVSFLAFLYYHTAHLLPIKSRFLKALVIAAILLEIKGYFLRQPLMNYLYNLDLGAKDPFFISFLSSIDVWAANLALGFCLVYLCPTRRN